MYTELPRSILKCHRIVVFFLLNSLHPPPIGVEYFFYRFGLTMQLKLCTSITNKQSTKQFYNHPMEKNKVTLNICCLMNFFFTSFIHSLSQ